MPPEYRRFWLATRAPWERERLLAEAFEAGATGAEEVESPERLGFRAQIYGPSEVIEAVRATLAKLADLESHVGEAEAIADVDWSEAWKEGLEALEVSSRLRVRPPFVETPLARGQVEVVIDPGQAFGTGSHASTALALEWIDALCAGSEHGPPPSAVLDVGTGSGVLALASLALGVPRAIGFDLDPVAVAAACAAAEANGLANRARFFTGPIDALADAPGSFGLVVANLLKREMLPIASALAERVSPSGRLVLTGLLEEDGPEVLARFSELGLVSRAGARQRQDGTGLWIGICLGHAP